ncbi:MAG: penicillin-binding protein 1C [Castellaniella sp.]|uniref:penicillin-binding protein 1C n=1 Tax=Castellaniella sp. TaxID=1955812 RepID=UPI003C729F76
MKLAGRVGSMGRCRVTVRRLQAVALALGLGLLVPAVSAQAQAPEARAQTQAGAVQLQASVFPPDYVAVREAWRPSDARLLASDGRELQRLRTDFSGRRGDWLPLSEVSVALQRAVVVSEDRRFYEHGGVDWLASASAAWSSAWGDGVRRGASTLSMQLAALLDPALRRGPGGRGILQKLDQMQAARVLESHWTKPQILEAYLNLAAWRGELVGVDALSRVLFQKHASGLTFREAALAAVLLRGPNAPLPTLVQRGCALLRELGRPDECQGLRGFTQAALSRAREARFDTPALAPHWARLVWDAGLADVHGEIRSTLDRGLQAAAVQSVRRRLGELHGTGVSDAAVVVLDNRSGAVLAYVGSSGALSEAADVDHARAIRQAGSTLKPFLYGLALDQQRLTAASLLDDSPVGLDGGGGLYVPDNYDHRFGGWVSARTALASSLNVPAVRTLMLVGPDALADRLVALGLPLDRGGDYYGYSLALGSADVTLLSLANAYRALARGGDYAPVNLRARPGAAAQTGVRLYSPEAAWIVGDMLADRAARARTFGLDSPLTTRFWTAVKTGTSRDMRDNWCVGWSADYTVGVWVGNSAGASMRHVSGVSGAGPVWHDVFDWLYRNHAPGEPARPPGVAAQAVVFGEALEPARTEYFLGDTAQARFAPPDAQDDPGRPRIAEPVDGTILALDPDIPWDRQRLRLRAVDARARPVTEARWFLDGAPHGEGRDPGLMADWAPRPGAHVFELRDAQGGVLDRARIIVRGGRFAIEAEGAGRAPSVESGVPRHENAQPETPVDRRVRNDSDAQGKH